MKVEKIAKIIQDWIENYCSNTSLNPSALVVGISGGIDSCGKHFVCKNWKKNHRIINAN